MRRKIKFRGLTKANNVMVFGDLIHCPNGSHRIIGYEQKGEIPLDVDYNDFNELIQSSTIGEFTGLHDKNGVDIYEGDILGGYPHGSVIVKWDDQYACFSCYDLEEQETDYGLFGNILDDCKDEFIVIGNIYQNPELLTSNTTQS
jgi:uncharacterized phage protein (TIGR01671 family)